MKVYRGTTLVCEVLRVTKVSERSVQVLLKNFEEGGREYCQVFRKECKFLTEVEGV